MLQHTGHDLYPVGFDFSEQDIQSFIHIHFILLNRLDSVHCKMIDVTIATKVQITFLGKFILQQDGHDFTARQQKKQEKSNHSAC